MAATKRDAAATRQRILRAAQHCFAEMGFFGARIDDIARRARVNRNMLYIYYGNKAGLYEAVLLETYREMAEYEAALLEEGHRGPAAIVAVLDLYFAFLEDHPDFVNILLWENLNRAKQLRDLPSEAIRRPSLGHLRELIVEGQRSGHFRRDIDPDQMVITLIAVCFGVFANRHTMSELFDRDLEDRDWLDARRQHTTDMVLAYMCPQMEES